jgi:hypothetical protein
MPESTINTIRSVERVVDFFLSGIKATGSRVDTPFSTEIIGSFRNRQSNCFLAIIPGLMVIARLGIGVPLQGRVFLSFFLTEF